MTVYLIDPSNWNDANFWNTIAESADGHVLDFSGLPSSFQLSMVSNTGKLSISDGTTTFVVGDASASGPVDAQLGLPTEFEYFSIVGASGNDTFTGSSGSENFSGSDGNDSFYGNSGNDTLSGGDGDDTFSIYGSGGGLDQIDGGAGFDKIEGSTGNDVL
ncbi:calcium-binding protein, partial [Cognatishimia sp. F0-27]|uniref:calcium-binding protein n=1 Tax=Cognatishimia sp. F0-27 TaxID=2816855 RepID=UPI001D6C912C|nr:calcium-binding protein [Cognatishimia sp. F0-27]